MALSNIDLATNEGSFVYTSLQLWPSDDFPICTFERSEGYDIQLVKRVDGAYRWHVSWTVDGIDVLLDIHQDNVIAVTVGPRAAES